MSNFLDYNMETPKNKLPEKAILFFNSLTNYLDTKLLFFGSIQRNDYFPGFSDIDVDIFTENEKSLVLKLQHLLNVPKEKFKKFIWKLQNGIISHGYKVMYKDEDNNFAVEFSIYNEKFKDNVLYEHKMKTVLPWYVSCLLIILKYLYYNFNLLDKKIFNYLKRKLLSGVIGLPDDKFIVLDDDPHETEKKIIKFINTGERD